MKRVFLLLMVIFLGVCCGSENIEEEDLAPKVISLGNSSTYEGLPVRSVIGVLSSDIQSGVRYKLVNGNGDSDNSDFFVDGSVLKSNVQFDFAQGTTKSLRIQANNKGFTFEKEFTITIKSYSGMPAMITSPSFNNRTIMPRNFGADNGNVSPDLVFHNVPSEANNIALMMRDLDSPSVHWSVWNIPVSMVTISKGQNWRTGIIKGGNDYMNNDYTGPFPPVGATHKYEITVYYLDSPLNLSPDKYASLPNIVAGKTLTQASIIGLYKT